MHESENDCSILFYYVSYLMVGILPKDKEEKSQIEWGKKRESFSLNYTSMLSLNNAPESIEYLKLNDVFVAKACTLEIKELFFSGFIGVWESEICIWRALISRILLKLFAQFSCRFREVKRRSCLTAFPWTQNPALLYIWFSYHFLTRLKASAESWSVGFDRLGGYRQTTKELIRADEIAY